MTDCPPRCPICGDELVVYEYERPNSPPGNRLACLQCEGRCRACGWKKEACKCPPDQANLAMDAIRDPATLSCIRHDGAQQITICDGCLREFHAASDDLDTVREVLGCDREHGPVDQARDLVRELQELFSTLDMKGAIERHRNCFNTSCRFRKAYETLLNLLPEEKPVV